VIDTMTRSLALCFSYRWWFVINQGELLKVRSLLEVFLRSRLKGLKLEIVRKVRMSEIMMLSSVVG
jgi:hypothetical protein